MTNKYIYITLLTLLGVNAESLAQATRQKDAPRLVVNIVIDQLRTDYLEAFTPLYGEKGFKRLLSEGIVYVNGTYPFTPVDRSSAMASLSTGTIPYYNGITGARWMNRETLRPCWSVDDAKYPGLLTSETASPVCIGTSTLSDELKMATDGRAIIFSIAPFRDAAVLTAGHAADGAIWIDDTYGMWCTSQYYATTLPSWVQFYNSVKAPGKRIDQWTWEPANQMVGSFNYFIQAAQPKPFKHKFTGDARFVEFKTSGMVNAEVTDLAEQCLENSGMGNDIVTDMLCLTYYAGTYLHQDVTSCQTELQDTYVRLDQTLARLINYLELRFSLDDILFIVTGTGYTDEQQGDYAKYRVPSGTFYMSRTAGLLNMYLGAIYGQGNYVEATFHNQFFLNHKLLETKHISIGDASGRAQEMLSMMSGIRHVYTALQLLTGQNQQIERIRNGYNAERCGDIIIETAPGWRILNEDLQESELTSTAYTQFPIIIFGTGVRAQRIDTPVSTTRIAATIARSVRIRAPNACFSEPLF